MCQASFDRLISLAVFIVSFFPRNVNDSSSLRTCSMIIIITKLSQLSTFIVLPPIVTHISFLFMSHLSGTINYPQIGLTDYVRRQVKCPECRGDYNKAKLLNFPMCQHVCDLLSLSPPHSQLNIESHTMACRVFRPTSRCSDFWSCTSKLPVICLIPLQVRVINLLIKSS
jgi:hypothetical protein